MQLAIGRPGFQFRCATKKSEFLERTNVARVEVVDSMAIFFSLSLSFHGRCMCIRESSVRRHAYRQSITKAAFRGPICGGYACNDWPAGDFMCGGVARVLDGDVVIG